jgi:hypothetical protein
MELEEELARRERRERSYFGCTEPGGTRDQANFRTFLCGPVALKPGLNFSAPLGQYLAPFTSDPAAPKRRGAGRISFLCPHRLLPTGKTRGFNCRLC